MYVLIDYDNFTSTFEYVGLVNRKKMKETIHDMEMSYGTTGSLFRLDTVMLLILGIPVPGTHL